MCKVGHPGSHNFDKCPHVCLEGTIHLNRGIFLALHVTEISHVNSGIFLDEQGLGCLGLRHSEVGCSIPIFTL